MNPILVNFSVFNKSVVDMVIKNNIIKSMIIVSDNIFKSDKNIDLLNFKHDDFTKKNYYRFLNLSHIDPIDQEILNIFATHEFNFMQMIMRFRPKEDYNSLYLEYLNSLKFWCHHLLRYKIDTFISLTVPHSGFDYVIYFLSGYYNINTIILQPMPSIKHKTYLMYACTDFQKQDILFEVDKKVENINTDSIPKLSPEIREYLTYLDDKFATNNGAAEFNFSFSKLLLRTIRNPLIYFRKIGTHLSFSNNVDTGFFRKHIIIFKNLLREYHLLKLDSFYRRLVASPNLDLSYAYLPLNYQPEMSTLPLAGRYSELEIMVPLISKLLPRGTMLYIKEHPRISNNRSKDFYNRILTNKNVLLVDRNFSPEKLIRNSDLVITTTGSVALEAHINQKPVIMFGDRIFIHFKGIFRVTSIDDVKNAIEKIYTSKISFQYKDIIQSLVFLNNACIKCSYVASAASNFNFSSEENDKNLYQLIRRGLNLNDKEINS